MNLSEMFANPKSQMGMLTLGNMLMQANPRTARMGDQMMQGGGALIQLQMAEQEKAAKAKAAQEKSLQETLFGLAEAGNADPDLYKLALEEHGVDVSSPRAKTWLKRATSEEEKQRNQAMVLFGEAGADLFDATKMSLKDMLSLNQEKRQGEKMEQSERHHQESLAIQQGNLGISREKLEMDREEAAREQATTAMIMEQLGQTGASGQSQPIAAGPEGGQVIPVGEGQVAPAQVQGQPTPTPSGGMTGLPMTDKFLKLGAMLAAQGDTGRANFFASAARLLSDKSPEGRQADIAQKATEAYQTELNRPVPLDALAKYQTQDGNPLPPGTTMGDLMDSGAIQLRPNQPMDASTRDKLLGGLNALEFTKSIRDAVAKGVKTGPISGPVSWAKVWFGAENETQYNEAKKQLVLAGQSVIPGIPSNYDIQTYTGTIPGWMDPPTMVQEKLRWNEKLSKQMIRTTISYFKGSATIIPPELAEAAKAQGIDLDSIGSSQQEEKKMKTINQGAKARLQKMSANSPGGDFTSMSDQELGGVDLSTLSPAERKKYSEALRARGY